MTCYALYCTAMHRIHKRGEYEAQSIDMAYKSPSGKEYWGPIKPIALDALRQMTKLLMVSVTAGDLQFLENTWYVTHAGLLRLAKRRRCCGIKTIIDEHLSDPAGGRWIF